MGRRRSAALVATLLAAVLGGCSDSTANPTGVDTTSTAPTGTPGTAPTGTPGTAPTGAPTKPLPSTSVPPSPGPPTQTAAATSTVGLIAIPSIQVSGLRVVAYNGTSDDRPGTRIQDQRLAASPRGPGGGVGPGQLGNFLVTAHRTTHGRPFGRLPEVRTGQHILVTAGGVVYDYVATETMKISFRSPTDLARQHAAVPGRPGERPTRAMITLSTCATPEDHAEGNYWSDALGNPEHRINKIGVLVARRPA